MLKFNKNMNKIDIDTSAYYKKTMQKVMNKKKTNKKANKSLMEKDACVDNFEQISIISLDKEKKKEKKSKKSKAKQSKSIKKTINKKTEIEEIFQIDFNELTGEEVEYSFNEYCGDLFNYQQIEWLDSYDMNDNFMDMAERDVQLCELEQLNVEEFIEEYAEESMREESMDLFCYEQLDFEEMKEDDVEESMQEESMDLFCYEQLDFEEMDEEKLQIAEKSMWNETGEVEFE